MLRREVLKVLGLIPLVGVVPGPEILLNYSLTTHTMVIETSTRRIASVLKSFSLNEETMFAVDSALNAMVGKPYDVDRVLLAMFTGR